MKILEDQYELVKDSRSVLLDYCQSISNSDFIKPVNTFGRGGTIRNLLTHITNTYKFWIGENILKKEMIYPDYSSVNNVTDVIDLFDDVNKIMQDFFAEFFEKENLKIEYEINGKKGVSDPHRIFLHAITHEFHHKGQILSLSRNLGYIPIDTDIMR